VIEIVIEGDELNPQGMLVDFKALKLALESYVDRYDHSMAVNSNDPAYAALQQSFPDQAFVVFSAEEPTTERIARDIYDFAAHILKDGFQSGPYRIEKGKNRVTRVRVGETPSSWAEYGD